MNCLNLFYKVSFCWISSGAFTWKRRGLHIWSVVRIMNTSKLVAFWKLKKFPLEFLDLWMMEFSTSLWNTQCHNECPSKMECFNPEKAVTQQRFLLKKMAQIGMGWDCSYSTIRHASRCIYQSGKNMSVWLQSRV